MKILKLALACIIALGAGIGSAIALASIWIPDLEQLRLSAKPFVSGGDRLNSSSLGMWASSAQSIEDLAAEADLIVRARVIERLPTRISLSPNKDLPPSVIPNTDSLFASIQIYKGSVGPNFIVVQPGGYVERTTEHDGVAWEMDDNPLFIPGTEHILFLVDVSDDAVNNQGQERELYVIVNPYGRLEVAGDKLHPLPLDGAGKQTDDVVTLEGQLRKFLN